MKWNRGLTYVAACLLGAGILVWVAVTVRKPAGEEEEADVEPLVAVNVATAEQHTVTTEVRLEGRVEALANQESRISAPLEGQLTRVAVREGEKVQAGQVLMELYNADLAGTVQAAHGSLTAAQAAAERAEKTVLLRDVEERTLVSKAEAALSKAQAELSLLKAGPRSQEVAQASATLEQELAKLHALETGTRPEQIAVARHQVEAERAALDRLHNGPVPQEIEAAEAALQAEQADLDRLKAGARPQVREQAKARAASAKSALETAEAEAKRKARLCDEGIVSVAEKQSAASAAAAARAEYVAATQDLSMVEQGPRAEEIRAQQAKRDQAGAELARVRSGSRAEEIAEQEAKLHAAEAALREAEAGPRGEEIEGQRAEVEKARKALELIQAPPRDQDVATAEAAIRDASAELDRARAGKYETGAVRADVRAAQGQREAAAGSLQYATATLAKSVIRAPISGTVSQLLANVGETVSPGSPVLELLNLNAVQVRGRVPVSDVAKLSVGCTAEITVEGVADRTFTGGVAVVSPDIDAETNTGQVVIWLANEDGALKEGMFATAIVRVEGVPAVSVPSRAVISAEGEQFVYTVEPGDGGEGLVAHRVTIKVGRTEGDSTEVLEGLEGTEQVVIEGAYGLPEEAGVTVGGEGPSDASP